VFAHRIEYVSEQEVVALHDDALREFGGKPGILDAAALCSSLALPKTAVFGTERFPTIIEKAAAYCYFIARNHPFVDGNKRTAFLTALHFLRKNGLTPRFDPAVTYDVLTRVAAGTGTLEELNSLFQRSLPQQT
jgi:death-on-curing protein